MDKDRVLKKLASVKAINTPSAVFSEIIGLIDKTDVSNVYLSNIILKDPALTVRLLKIANSAAYGVTHEVTSVSQALMVMGLNAVKLHILSVTIFNQVTSQNKEEILSYKSLWQHFLEVGAASRKLAEKINYPVAEEAYIAGLIHDIGILVLLDNFKGEYKQVINRAACGIDLPEAERLVFGVDHQEVADFIAGLWNLPKKLRQAISIHHNMQTESTKDSPVLCRIVALADCIASVPFHDLDKQFISKTRISALDKLSKSLGFQPEDIQDVHARIHKEVVMTAEMLDIEIGDAFEVLAQSNAELFNIYLQLSSIFRERQELSRQILVDERMEGSLESLKISLATLSHYINNATMNIQGKCEILQLYINKNERDTMFDIIPDTLSSIRKSVSKISLVLEELANLTSMENLNFFNHSKAIDIETKLKQNLNEQFEKV